MLDVYLASPATQQQADHCAGMNVLVSFACYPRGRKVACGTKGPWLDDYLPSFDKVLCDSGAFSELNSGVKVDLTEFAEWAMERRYCFVAIAGLDDISGDWRRSLANYEAFPLGFPTFHETDPPELLDDLIALSLERPQGGSGNGARPWLGIGLLPETRQRRAKTSWLRETCDRIPDRIHVHGWACRAYTGVRRLDSVDSTNWFRDAMKLRTIPDLAHLTYGECLRIVVKRYQRWERRIVDQRESTNELVFAVEDN